MMLHAAFIGYAVAVSTARDRCERLHTRKSVKRIRIVAHSKCSKGVFNPQINQAHTGDGRTQLQFFLNLAMHVSWQ